MQQRHLRMHAIFMVTLVRSALLPKHRNGSYMRFVNEMKDPCHSAIVLLHANSTGHEEADETLQSTSRKESDALIARKNFYALSFGVLFSRLDSQEIWIIHSWVQSNLNHVAQGENLEEIQDEYGPRQYFILGASVSRQFASSELMGLDEWS